MKITEVPFRLTDRSRVEATEHPGITGKAICRTPQFDDIRVCLVEYTPGYLADHWCDKGHILLCLEGRLDTELAEAPQPAPQPVLDCAPPGGA